jgi:hypothetical protein
VIKDPYPKFGTWTTRSGAERREHELERLDHERDGEVETRVLTPEELEAHREYVRKKNRPGRE